MSSVGQGMGRALNYAAQVAIARMYGPTQLGFYVLGSTLVGIANILAEFGLSDAAIRYVAQHQAEEDVPRTRGTIISTLGMSFALSLALSAAMFVGAGFLADEVFNEPSAAPLFRVFSISVPFLTVLNMALWNTQGFQTVKYSTYAKQIFQPLVNLGLIMVTYLLGAQILGAVTAYVISMAAGAVLALYYLKRIFPELLSSIKPRFESRKLIIVSFPVMVSTSVEYVNSWAPLALLGIFATSEEVGIYSAAARTALLSAMVYLAFAGIFSPVASNLYRRGLLEDLNRIYKDVSRWIFIGGLAIFLLTALLSRDIMAIFGESFITGWIAVVIIAGAQLFNSSIGASEHALIMTGHQREYMLATLAGTVATIVAGMVLIPAYGILGAAWAATACILVASVATLAMVHVKLGFWPYSREYLQPLVAAVVTAAAFLLVKTVVPLWEGILGLLVLAPLILSGFAAMLLLLGLNVSDRQLLNAIWMAVRRTVRRGS